MFRGDDRSDERVMRAMDWAFPPEVVQREVHVVEARTEAAGPPILFVHGLGRSAGIFGERWMGWLADRGWTSVAVSLRGHGGSGGDRHRATLRHYEHDVLQTIVDLDEPPVLVGHGAGASVVLRVLERYAARAGVLLAPRPVGWGLRAGASVALHEPALAFRALFGAPAPDEPPGLINRLEMLAPQPVRPTKARLLVMAGDADPMLPVASARRTATRLGAELRLFNQMGHDLMVEPGWERPIAAMVGWLARTGVTRR